MSAPKKTPPKFSREGAEASALVDAAKLGDQKAFEVLYSRYRGRIYALALHLTGSPTEAEDITQDAFLRAYRNLEKFEGRSAFFTWIYRITLHRALNNRRKQRPTVGFDDPRVSAAIAVDAAGDPRRALELQERYAYLITAFDALSPLLRTTVVLTTLQGLSYQEAAVVLDTSEGTIAWRVHEARRLLRKRMVAAKDEPVSEEVKRRAKRISGEHEAVSFDDLLEALVPSFSF